MAKPASFTRLGAVEAMNHRGRMGLYAVAIILGVSQTTDAATAQLPLPQELSWVGLFNSELVSWLENENRLKELCGADAGAEKWRACRETYLEPKVVVIPVRSGPRPDASRLGQMVLVAWPGKGLRIFASTRRLAEPFTPDLFDADWGYGPYFHQTILARRGLWFRIPLPVIGTGWINAEDWSDRDQYTRQQIVPAIETLEVEKIVTTPRGDMYVLGVENRVLRVRPEQDTDMPCGGSELAPPAPSKEIRIPFEQLFDSKGHLLISYKYTRGC